MLDVWSQLSPAGQLYRVALERDDEGVDGGDGIEQHPREKQ